MSTIEQRQIHDAVIIPYKRPLARKFKGGILLPDTERDGIFRHRRQGRPVDRKGKDKREQSHLPGSFNYGGPLMNHFGHFMAECIHRVLPGMQYDPQLPWLFVGTRVKASRQQGELPGYVRDAFRFLKVDTQSIRVVDHPLKVDQLQVCTQGSDLGLGPLDSYLSLLDEFSPKRLDELSDAGPAYDRLYVTRSAFVRGGLLGESHLEAVLAAAGFHIYKPEQHSLIEQMQAYRRAKLLVFAEGSAIHGVELMGRMLQTVVLINRREPAKLDQFKRVLSPRAERFFSFEANVLIGGLPSNRRGRAMPHNGSSLIDMVGLSSFLSRNGLAELGDLRIDDYRAAAAADLERFIDSAQSTATDPACVAQAVPGLRDSFEAALQALARPPH